MKTVLVSARADSEAIAAKFRAELPGHHIVTDAPSDGVVAYAVVGKPEPGVLSGLHGVELILSLNAGIEYLLGLGEIPDDVPIVRLVDPGMTAGMTEWVVAQLLAWHRNLFTYRDQQRAGTWIRHPELMARERVVTILGAGALGGAVAAMLASLDFQLRTWSRSGRAPSGIEGFAADQLAQAVTGADAIVSLLPSTPETADCIDAALLARLNPGALLVNAGRGAAVVDADVVTALDTGQLGWAVLDVFRTEPLPADHPYWAHPRVFVSPHVAAPTHARTAVAVIAETIRRHEQGQVVPHIVDRATGY